MRRMFPTVTLALMASVVILAGNGRGGRADVDLSTLRTVSGAVDSVSMDCGLGHPGFTMKADDGTTFEVHLGPYRYLVSKNFSVAVGDDVVAKVADCPKTADANDVVAFEVTDSTTGAYIALRDDLGVPYWSGRHRHGTIGQGWRHGQERNGCRRGGYGVGHKIDLFTLVEKSGTVVATSFGIGTHSNSIEFESEGESYTLVLGPYWYMTQEGFAVRAGDSIKTEMAECAKGWVAFSLTNVTTGKSIQFRDENGLPLWLD